MFMKKLLSNRQFHPVKRLLQKIAIKAIKITDPNRLDKTHGDYEHEAISICKKLIAKPETLLLISPISGKRYIRSEDKQLSIIIQNYEVTIVNHSYSYDIKIEPKAYSKISNIFDHEVEKRRMEMENEIRSNVKHSLSNIYKNITKYENA